MARLIDANVLLDKLQEIANDFEHPREAVINLDALYEMIVDDIPTVAKDINVPDKWVSVKDRLPTSIVNKVLVWLEHENLNGYIGFGHYEKYKGQEIWYDLEHNEAFSIRGYTVTHWMPFPEPPKEE